MKGITLPSPAKLNLALQVINKRPDGYHNIKTLFERIDLHDDITLTPTPHGKIRIFCDHPHVPRNSKNLVYRVAALLQERHGVNQGVDIRITKRIPVAAGLAGGSSNAATTFLGLNRIWDLGLKKDQLVAYGKLVGSDVPFFLHDCSWGLGTDRGDHIKALPITTKMWHVLIVPRIKMYSREVFTHSKMQLTKKGDNVNILIRSLQNSNIKRLGKLLFNDLESSILAISPSLLNAKKKLEAFSLNGVLFSGSGPAVFGITNSRQEAEDIRRVLSHRYRQVFVVKTN